MLAELVLAVDAAAASGYLVVETLEKTFPREDWRRALANAIKRRSPCGWTVEMFFGSKENPK
jgi:hypothetical protein